MKTTICIKRENSETGERYSEYIIGNKHKLKLITGEVLNVVTDKRQEYWFVTDVETGLLLVPRLYYGFINYDPQHDVYKERNALETAKFCINRHLTERNMTFAEMRVRRLNNLKKEEE